MNHFLWGAIAMACFASGLFFLRYFAQSRERLFAFFCLAFWTLALHWMLLAAREPAAETRHYYYIIRLVAFGLILAGIVDKNARSRG
jgi:hypothetical protein